MKKLETNEAKIKEADSLMALADKFYWTPHIVFFGYFVRGNDSNFFFIIILAFMMFYIAIKHKEKALQIYDEIYNLPRSTSGEVG